MRAPATGIKAKIAAALACLAISCAALVGAAPAFAASPKPSAAAPSAASPSPATAPTTAPAGSPAVDVTKAPLPSDGQVLASFAPGANQACSQPLHGWTYVEPSLSKPLEPKMYVWYDGFRYGGQAVDDWGNDKSDVVNMVQQPTGSAAQLVFTPKYGKAGTYTMRSMVTDACQRALTVYRTLTVPVVLPALDSVKCPGEIADQGVCIVDSGKDAVFSVTGPDADGGWDWTVFTSGPILNASSVKLTLKFGDVTYIQASRLSPDGKSTIVTPILPVDGSTVAAPQITDFTDPGKVYPGDKVDLSFVPPTGFGSGSPSISIDGVVMAQSTEYSTSFDTTGQHTVDYAYAISGYTTARASASIIVATPDNWLPIVLGVIAVVVLLIGLLMGLWVRAEWRNLRRRRARAKRRAARAARLAETTPDEQE